MACWQPWHAPIPGTFLLLRGMSMMGDAISHAVLPGIAIGFLISGSRDSVWMFVGAAVAGIVAAVLTQFLHRFGRLDRGASMGVVFTTFFALGLILIVYTADHVELDPECVLYGAIELAPIDLLSIAGIEVPRSLPVLVVIGLLNLILMILLYKEFKICSFDPAMARASGINVQLMNQILMIMTAATCVACFEVVGSILVVALLVVPAATARLLSDRLNIVLILAMVIGSIGAAARPSGGYQHSRVVPDRCAGHLDCRHDCRHDWCHLRGGLGLLAKAWTDSTRIPSTATQDTDRLRGCTWAVLSINGKSAGDDTLEDQAGPRFPHGCKCLDRLAGDASSSTKRTDCDRG